MSKNNNKIKTLNSSRPNYLITLNYEKFIQKLKKKSFTQSKEKVERSPQKEKIIRNILLKHKKEKEKNGIKDKRKSIKKKKINNLNQSLFLESLQKKIGKNKYDTLYLDYIKNNKNKKFDKNRVKGSKKNRSDIYNNYTINKDTKNLEKNIKLKIKNNGRLNITYLNKPVSNLNNSFNSKDNDNNNNQKLENILSDNEYSPRSIKIKKIKHKDDSDIKLDSISIDEEQINKDKNIVDINYSTLNNELNDSNNYSLKHSNNSSLNSLNKKEKYLLTYDDINSKNKLDEKMSKETPSTTFKSEMKINDIFHLNNLKIKIYDKNQDNIFNEYKNEIKNNKNKKEHSKKNNSAEYRHNFKLNNKEIILNSSINRFSKKNNINITTNNNIYKNWNKKINDFKGNLNFFSPDKTRNNKKVISNNKRIHKICYTQTFQKTGPNIHNIKSNNFSIEKPKTNKNKKYRTIINHNNYTKIKSLSKTQFSVQPKKKDFNINLKEKEEKNRNNNNKYYSKISFNKTCNNIVSPNSIKKKNNSLKKEYPNMANYIKDNKKYSVDIIGENNDKSYKNQEPKSILNIFSLCRKGYSGPEIRKTNQDNFFIYHNFNNNSNYVYMGVCDGHGIFGQDISTYLVNNLPQNMSNNIGKNRIKNISTENIQILSKIFIDTFIQTNNELNEDERIDSTYSGSTCVSLLFTPTKVFCINVGDSRCIIGKYNGDRWTSKNLSRDHKPSDIDEMKRIIENGGKVEALRNINGNFIGPQRVWTLNGPGPGLAMSRSFGDEIAHQVGVCVEPEIIEYYFLKEDKFIILASDGIWEFISSEDSVNMIKDFYIQNDINGAINYIYNEASRRWIMEEEVIDDITVIIVFLK